MWADLIIMNIITKCVGVIYRISSFLWYWTHAALVLWIFSGCFAQHVCLAGAQEMWLCLLLRRGPVCLQGLRARASVRVCEVATECRGGHVVRRSMVTMVTTHASSLPFTTYIVASQQDQWVSTRNNPPYVGTIYTKRRIYYWDRNFLKYGNLTQKNFIKWILVWKQSI